MNKLITYGSIGILCLAVLYLMYLNSTIKKDMDVLRKSLESFKKDLVGLSHGFNQLLSFTQEEPVHNEPETKNEKIDSKEQPPIKNENKDENELNNIEQPHSKLTEQYDTYRKTFEYNEDLSNELKQEIDNLPDYNSEHDELNDNEENSTKDNDNTESLEQNEEHNILENNDSIEEKKEMVEVNSDTTQESDVKEELNENDTNNTKDEKPSEVSTDNKKDIVDNQDENTEVNDIETNQLLNDFESFQNNSLETDSKKLTLDELKLLNVKDLKQVARDNNLKLKGSKSELIERISKHL